MICPHCGAETPAVHGHCTACGKSLAPARPVAATGVLTPPPVPSGASSPDNDVTRLPGGRSALDPADAPTIWTGGSTPPPEGTPGGRPLMSSARWEDDTTGLPDLRPGGSSKTGPPPTPAGAGPDAAVSTGVDDAATYLPDVKMSPAGTGPLALGQRFGPRYQIIRLLGIGGMGAVYQAWDAELDVVVAVKVIRPEATSDPDDAREIERRFKQELLLARQVTHKNVVRIHDLGEIDGIKYITMSYIEGADLATVLKQAGKLPVTAALKIARQVAAGLVAAHEAGVVHRDLKPANIMVEGDNAVIMDFGIARSASGARPAVVPPGNLPPGVWQKVQHTPQGTIAGTIVGTVAYMAPEQAKGQAVDQRADLYALGLIVSDMLLGPRPRSGGESTVEELQHRMKEAPPPLRTMDPEIPEAVERIVSRCLEPDPAARFQTTAELVAELDRLDENGKPLPLVRRLTPRLIAAAAVLVIAMLGGTYYVTRRAVEPPKQHDPVSVLIADFQNPTNDPAFNGTLEQALGTAVEGASFITAYSRTTAQGVATQLKLGRLDEAAARLVSAREGINVILAGSVESRNSGYTISVKAVDPANGNTLGVASASASTKGNVLKAVGSVAAEVRGILGDTTPESEKLAAAETVTTASLEALQAYERGQELARSSKLEEALEAYQRAIKLDPGFGRAYAGMAVVYDDLKDEAKTKAAYEEALKRVDRMTEREKYRTLGTYYLLVAHNYEKAIENYETLLKLYPADSAGHGNLGMAYMLMGNPERAATESRALLKIYPKNFRQRRNLAMYFMYSGNFSEAVTEGSRINEEAPSFALGYLPVALSMLASGDAGGALKTYDRLEATGAVGAGLARLGRVDLAMYRGRHREAQKLVANAIAADQNARNSVALAQDFVAAAQTALALGQRRPAADAALRAVTLSTHESVLFPAALVLIETGGLDEARKIALALENILQAQTTAYARLIDAEIAAHERRYGQAIEAFRDSTKRRDTWFARYLLGRTYAETEHFAEAMAELELAAKRRGEVTDVFIFDMPTLRYLPPVYYWLARAQEAMGVADARKTYEQYLALRADADPPDPLVADSQARLASLPR